MAFYSYEQLYAMFKKENNRNKMLKDNKQLKKELDNLQRAKERYACMDLN